jgi:DNA-binding IclR family transcriptional regulator
MTAADGGSAVARALAIIGLIAASDKPLSIADLTEQLDLPKATVHRLVMSLWHQGILQREPDSKRFAAGRGLTDLAINALRNSAQRAVRHAILQGLVDRIKETCNFNMMDQNEIVYIDRVEADWPLRVHFQPGSRVPLHCTATGKLFLSQLPAARRRRLISTLNLKAHTPNTFTDPERLEAELLRIRAQKVGTDNEEFLAGLVAVSVPIHDRRNRICAALAVHGPIGRLSFEQALSHVPKLRAAAIQLSQTLFGTE